ncbi:uroporphyrinogen-III synthase [Rickettsiales bacterium]|nr:uroporphyrinogen-III synthase [Rickettsiales bacterium]
MKILLTRPDIDSKNLAFKLKNLRHTVEITPLIRINKVKSNKEINFGDFDVVVFTSKNGIKYLESNSLKKKLIFTVGEGTYNEAKKKGYRNIKNTNGDAVNLINCIKKKFYQEEINLLHVTSLEPNKNFVGGFSNTNISYETLSVYESRKIDFFKLKVEKFLIQNNGVLTFFSSKTAESFLDIVTQLKLHKYCTRQIIIVLSNQIINRLKNLKFKKVYIAEKPNEESLLGIINNL